MQAVTLPFRSTVTYASDLMTTRPRLKGSSLSNLGVINLTAEGTFELLKVDVDSGRQSGVEFSMPVNQLAYMQNYYNYIRIGLPDGTGFILMLIDNADQADKYELPAASAALNGTQAIPDSQRPGDLGWWLKTLVEKGAPLKHKDKVDATLFILTILTVIVAAVIVYVVVA